VILGQENVSLYGAPWRLDYLSFLQEIWLLGESYQKQVSMGNGILATAPARNFRVASRAPVRHSKSLGQVWPGVVGRMNLPDLPDKGIQSKTTTTV